MRNICAFHESIVPLFNSVTCRSFFSYLGTYPALCYHNRLISNIFGHNTCSFLRSKTHFGSRYRLRCIPLFLCVTTKYVWYNATDFIVNYGPCPRGEPLMPRSASLLTHIFLMVGIKSTCFYFSNSYINYTRRRYLRITVFFVKRQVVGKGLVTRTLRVEFEFSPTRLH